MMLKIYFGEKTLFIADRVHPEFEEAMHHPETILVEELNHPALHSLLHELKKVQFNTGIWLHPDVQSAQSLLFEHFTCIEAAGGMVENEEGAFLFINRLAKWDLPKGKIEEGESPEACAVREIMEETGLKEIELSKKIGITYHTYDAFGKHFLKTNHWFHFKVKSASSLTPQIEEDITEIKWFKKSELNIPLSDTYPSIRDVVNMFQQNN